MSYENLPLQQRMQMAREYATILIEDEVPGENITGVLAETFSLTPSEAETAFAEMKIVYKGVYFKAKNKRI